MHGFLKQYERIIVCLFLLINIICALLLHHHVCLSIMLGIMYLVLPF